jgi:LPS export ABC transporter permease LptF/LPS export ABC transporter permease LptG
MKIPMILDRYLIREIVPNVLLGLMVFTFVMLMNQILLLAELLITRGIGFSNIFLIIYYSLPALTVLTIPMALLLGILLGLGRLSADSELTVMRASGISLYRLILPIMAVAAIFWMICSYLIQVTVPWGNYAFSRFMYKVMTTNATSQLKPRVFYNQFPGMVLYIQDIRADTWNGVFVYDESKPTKPRIVLAKEGRVREKGANELELELKYGSWHEVNPRQPQDYTSVNFLQNTFPLPMPGQLSTGQDIPKNERDQTIPELKKAIVEQKEKKLPYRSMEVEIQKKYAIPFVCIVFAFLATSLGVSARKGGRSSAYAVSIGIILVYYVFLITGERLGDAGSISPWLAAWIGNVFLGIIGIILFFRLNSAALLRSFGKLRSSRILRPQRTSTEVATKKRRTIRVVIRIQRSRSGLFTLLDQYIVREFLKNFLLILFALVLISELIVAVQLVDDLFRNKVGVDVLLQYLKFDFPQWVFYILPVSALTTTLVTFGAMTKNSEIIAMKSSGISLYRISVPLIVVAIGLSIFAYWLQDYILPYTNKIANNYKREIRGERPEIFSTFERHWISGDNGFYNYDVFDVRTNRMYGFSVYEVNLQEFVLKRRVYARDATFKQNAWFLGKGWQRIFTRGKVRYEPFQFQQIKLPVNPDYFKTEQELPSEMTFAELRSYIQKIKERGFDFVRPSVDLQAKVSFPTVSLILSLIAIPFSFTTGRRGALYGIGLSILMGIVFWFFLALTKSLGYLEILNPFLAAWTPNILATLIALYLLFKLKT